MLVAKQGGSDMKLTIKSFDVGMEVKNAGVEFDIHSPNGSEFLGDVILTKAGLIWCDGKTTRANGKKVTWQEFQNWAAKNGK
jgi:hypothetical protein